VEDFGQYELDFQTIMDNVISSQYSPPVLAFAHSMGAAVLLRSARHGKQLFDRIVLTAPMIGLPGLRSSAIARAAFRVMRDSGFGTSYVPFGKSTSMDLRPFVSNHRTSDLKRYKRNAEILAVNPGLGVGSPTVAWTDAALKAMREFSHASYPEKFLERVLIVASGQDDIVSASASRRFATRQRIASCVVIPGARHELLMERDPFRRQFWSAFDAFTASG
jgi:lysophospholipase